MNLFKRSGRAVCALFLGFLAGCGSSSSTDTAPSTVTTFFAHTAVFKNDTTPYLSGYNAFGQLGNDSFENRSEFQSVPGLGLSRVSGVALGGVHTLAFQNNSSVRAWGSNSLGQLGSASETGSTRASKTPVTVVKGAGAVLSGVTSIAAGSYHSLAVSNGEVYAWGNNSYGQLGDGTESDRNYAARVVDSVTGTYLANVKQVAAGGLFSLALKNDGTVWGWGNSEYGQLGSTVGVQSSTKEATLVGGITDVKFIAAAGSYAVAVKNDGTVWAWGLNNWAQLARPTTGTTNDLNATPQQVMLSSGTGSTPLLASTVAAGTDHVLALSTAGEVWGWGMNYYGQLGSNNKGGTSQSGPENTTLYLSATPVRVVTSSAAGNGGTPLAHVTQIYAYGHSSFASTADPATGVRTLYAWGANAYGQLGFSDQSKLNYQENPVAVSGF